MEQSDHELFLPLVDEENICLRITSYNVCYTKLLRLKHSINFHEREWKLINRHVENGHVFLTPHETVRLIRKELGTYINSKIVNAKTPSMITGFEEPVRKLMSLSKKFTTFTVSSGEYPPCIKHAITILEKGENLPHSGRFMLATFLRNNFV